MKKLFVIGNWKMNPDSTIKAERLFDIIEKGIKKIKALKNAEVVICPPFVYLEELSSSRLRSLAPQLKLGAQDCHWEQSGAYTGEVSPKMLRDLDCKYAIIGHSERRKYLGETNEMINKKLLAVFKARLKPVLCVGEKEGEEMGLIVERQLVEGLRNTNRGQMQDLIIAYEPVWAIGTGNPCKPDDALKATLFIRQTLSKLYNRKLAEEIPALYGGSVNSKIARDYIEEAGMSGLLIGGASLDGMEFVRIVKSVQMFNTRC